MKKALALLLMASFILVACETKGPLAAIPKKPDVETQRGRDCIKECDDQNELCRSSCESVRWDRKKQCWGECYEQLEKCYQLCSEEGK
jgi:predicted small lipoprotein YifL